MRSEKAEKLWDVYTARAGDRVYHGVCEAGTLKDREDRGWRGFLTRVARLGPRRPGRRGPAGRETALQSFATECFRCRH